MGMAGNGREGGAGW